MLDHARNLGCQLQIKQQHFGFADDGESWSWWGPNQDYANLPKPRLALDNVATAIAAVCAAPLPVSAEAIAASIKTAMLAGGESITETHISTITDTIILLRYVELHGEMRRGLREGDVEYLMVNMRMTTAAPRYGYYFESGEYQETPGTPIDARNLLKFNTFRARF